MSKIELLKDRLRKILALAQSGEKGEKDAAQILLDRLLKENNLTLEDITGSEVSVHWIKTGSSEIMKQLLSQIQACVLGVDRASYYTAKGVRDEVGIECTKSEFIDIKTLFDAYSKALKEELEKAKKATFRAFLNTNDLLVKFGGDQPHKDLTTEEKEIILKSLVYGQGMKKTQVYKQIED